MSHHTASITAMQATDINRALTINMEATPMASAPRNGINAFCRNP